MPADQSKKTYERYSYFTPGNRITKRLHQITGDAQQQQLTRYIPELELHIAGFDDTLTEKYLFITLGTTRIQYWINGKPGDNKKIQVRYCCSNNSCSRTLEMDSEAGIISCESYYPFGGTAVWSTCSQTEAHYKTRRYSGKERDVTGLVYFGWRYYAPWLMRWFNPDPAGDIDGLNLFVMTGNSPLTFSDADGRMYTENNITHMTPGEAIDAWMADTGKKQMNKSVVSLFHAHIAQGSLTISGYDNVVIDDGFRHVCVWPMCDYKTNLKSSYDQHLRRHTGEKPYLCSWHECGAIFAQQSSLTEHYRIHTQEMKYSCDRPGCTRKFIHHETFSSHLAAHDNLRKYRCKEPGCKERFNKKRMLSKHIKSVHATESNFICYEKNCKKKFKTDDLRSLHVVATHRVKRYSCNHCEFKAHLEYLLKKHMVVHSGERNEVCRHEGCGQTYKWTWSRNRHEHLKHNLWLDDRKYSGHR